MNIETMDAMLKQMAGKTPIFKIEPFKFRVVKRGLINKNTKGFAAGHEKIQTELSDQFKENGGYANRDSPNYQIRAETIESDRFQNVVKNIGKNWIAQNVGCGNLALLATEVVQIECDSQNNFELQYTVQSMDYECIAFEPFAAGVRMYVKNGITLEAHLEWLKNIQFC